MERAWSLSSRLQAGVGLPLGSQGQYRTTTIQTTVSQFTYHWTVGERWSAPIEMALAPPEDSYGSILALGQQCYTSVVPN